MVFKAFEAAKITDIYAHAHAKDKSKRRKVLISRHNRRNYRKQRNKPSLNCLLRKVFKEFYKGLDAFDFEILPEVFWKRNDIFEHAA
ncbi:unnamed protein product [Rhizophagus irregularis]|nr:unnamed protein product [Rhizophagus irregularis]